MKLKTSNTIRSHKRANVSRLAPQKPLPKQKKKNNQADPQKLLQEKSLKNEEKKGDESKSEEINILCENGHPLKVHFGNPYAITHGVDSCICNICSRIVNISEMNQGFARCASC